MKIKEVETCTAENLLQRLHLQIQIFYSLVRPILFYLLLLQRQGHGYYKKKKDKIIKGENFGKKNPEVFFYENFSG